MEKKVLYDLRFSIPIENTPINRNDAEKLKNGMLYEEVIGAGKAIESKADYYRWEVEGEAASLTCVRRFFAYFTLFLKKDMLCY